MYLMSCNINVIISKKKANQKNHNPKPLQFLLSVVNTHSKQILCELETSHIVTFVHCLSSLLRSSKKSPAPSFSDPPTGYL